MTLTTYKIICAAIIFGISLIAALLPARLASERKGLLLSEAFANGVFLGAALLHMLPHALEGMTAALPHAHYPWVLLFCALGFFTLLLIERTTHCYHHHNHHLPYILFTVLAIHSFIAGAAFGVNTTIASASVVFFAIIAHKGSASFALSTEMRRYEASKKQTNTLMIVFSFMTPIGIGLATIIMQFLQNSQAQMLSAGFNAFAAGTFLYIGTLHILSSCNDDLQLRERMQLACAPVLGLSIMAIIAIWL